MPNCFTLTKKGEDRPATLNSVDEAICEFLGRPVHEINWVCGWYDSIGLGFACGTSFERMRELFSEYPDLLKILGFLEENYTVNAWAEIGRR